MKKKITVILCSLLMVLLIGCGGDASNSLVGHWVSTDENEGDFFEFFSDGTGIISDNDGTSYSINWIAENDRLKVSINMGLFGDMSFLYNYKVDKNSLILSDDEENMATYTRVKESQ